VQAARHPFGYFPAYGLMAMYPVFEIPGVLIQQSTNCPLKVHKLIVFFPLKSTERRVDSLKNKSR
jgi:hypothetical protein